MSCAALILGVHLYTAHVRDDLNNVNPGVYAQCDSLVVGTYYNSVRKQSAYVGYVYSIGPIDIMSGVVTGYSKPLQPMFVPSIKVDSFRFHLLIPSKQTARGGIHISFERDF